MEKGESLNKVSVPQAMLILSQGFEFLDSDKVKLALVIHKSRSRGREVVVPRLSEGEFWTHYHSKSLNGWDLGPP